MLPSISIHDFFYLLISKTLTLGQIPESNQRSKFAFPRRNQLGCAVIKLCAITEKQVLLVFLANGYI